ncbi:MAG: hypothetical protein H0V33_08810 [Acidimicrobiia bacterium]|jgi:hypothetical protein|nr:hypothetical protein [Acidimicrobiia bacterium]
MRAQARPARPTILVLLGAAAALRVMVVIVATAFGPADAIGDIIFHSQLLADPVGHLRQPTADLEQYAPYLGFAEWVTARPWIALGAGETTALRMGSILWDLAGMAVLLVAVARAWPERLVLAGVLWAASPLLWPASALAAQDEPIAAALTAVALLLLVAGRPAGAVAVLTVGLFVAKVLLAPIIVAVALTAPPSSRARIVGTGVTTLLVCVLLTFAVGARDGLSSQFSYRTDLISFSMTPWSTLVLHHAVDVDTALDVSVPLALVACIVVMVAWFGHRSTGSAATTRLGAALLFASFAMLAVSNPEYLAIAAPLAVMAVVATERRPRPWFVVAAAGLAWFVNLAYYALRTAYDATGSILPRTGFRGDLSGRVRLLDIVHQAGLVLCWGALVAVAWRWAHEESPPSTSPSHVDDAAIAPVTT